MEDVKEQIEAMDGSAHFADGYVTVPAYQWEQLKQLAGIEFKPEYLEKVAG